MVSTSCIGIIGWVRGVDEKPNKLINPSKESGEGKTNSLQWTTPACWQNKHRKTLSSGASLAFLPGWRTTWPAQGQFQKRKRQCDETKSLLSSQPCAFPSRRGDWIGVLGVGWGGEGGEKIGCLMWINHSARYAYNVHSNQTHFPTDVKIITRVCTHCHSMVHVLQ